MQFGVSTVKTHSYVLIVVTMQVVGKGKIHPTTGVKGRE